MSKIVITGGCGYIGSHIARAIKQHKATDQVFVIDRVRHDHTLKGVNGYLIDDFTSKQSLMWIESLEPDVIIHCAGSSSVSESIVQPAEYYENNVAKTIKLLTHLKGLNKIPLVLFSSSASVYGNPTTMPITEDFQTFPISPYGTSKLIIEGILHDFNLAYNMSSVCFRYFNAAGAEPTNYDLGQPSGASHIVASIIEAKLNSRPFVLNGNDYNTADKTCIRDYVHVWDIADAHVKAINFYGNPEATPVSVILNLGTQHGISNQEIINYVIEKYGTLDITHGVRRKGDPDMLVADASKARTILGWEPTHSSISKIVDTAYQWYTNWYRNNHV